ncbi:hypothetical protein CDAR_24131 [Caerostris darwini]|uniref:Uncharacterized protein n=1 Tax=Caerostris darwini TaxID=1538125 RepID=A0AAV4QH32_9ARAC|nr:hypothetical protein CDAR_24131 [Caerostris darwini]
MYSCKYALSRFPDRFVTKIEILSITQTTKFFTCQFAQFLEFPVTSKGFQLSSFYVCGGKVNKLDSRSQSPTRSGSLNVLVILSRQVKHLSGCRGRYIFNQTY